MEAATFPAAVVAPVAASPSIEATRILCARIVVTLHRVVIGTHSIEKVYKADVSTLVRVLRDAAYVFRFTNHRPFNLSECITSRLVFEKARSTSFSTEARSAFVRACACRSACRARAISPWFRLKRGIGLCRKRPSVSACAVASCLRYLRPKLPIDFGICPLQPYVSRSTSFIPYQGLEIWTLLYCLIDQRLTRKIRVSRRRSPITSKCCSFVLPIRSCSLERKSSLVVQLAGQS